MPAFGLGLAGMDQVRLPGRPMGSKAAMIPPGQGADGVGTVEAAVGRTGRCFLFSTLVPAGLANRGSPFQGQGVCSLRPRAGVEGERVRMLGVLAGFLGPVRTLRTWAALLGDEELDRAEQPGPHQGRLGGELPDVGAGSALLRGQRGIADEAVWPEIDDFDPQLVFSGSEC